jgi:hypothetical protein
VHPDAPHLAGDLVECGLSVLAGQSPRPVHTNLRKYESGIRAQLEAAGFELQAERVLLVRQTAAWCKSPAPELVPALSGGARPVPPTYQMSGEPEGQPSNGWLQHSADQDARGSL